ncbi:MAG TPA: YkgJ family cysteine cluster protein [Terracidiphilus sp.]|nr:YkgJ family cysteine cluster protein [Terracidiphilus sp.]
MLPLRDAELIQIVDASFAQAARRAGPHLVCRPGCTQCCHGVFPINALDAARLRAGIRALHAADPSAAEAIQTRARAWLIEHGDAFPGDRETGILGTTAENEEKFESYAKNAPCPALDLSTGLCSVYAWRPMTCRVFGPPIQTADENGAEALGHCELCFTRATPEEVAACEMPIPHALESELVAELGSSGETIVAFALLN